MSTLKPFRLSTEDMSELAVIKYVAKKAKELDCPVPANLYNVNNCNICITKSHVRCILSPCGHGFCYTCINEWMRTSGFTKENIRCPSCNDSIPKTLIDFESTLVDLIHKNDEDDSPSTPVSTPVAALRAPAVRRLSSAIRPSNYMHHSYRPYQPKEILPPVRESSTMDNMDEGDEVKLEMVTNNTFSMMTFNAIMKKTEELDIIFVLDLSGSMRDVYSYIVRVTTMVMAECPSNYLQVTLFDTKAEQVFPLQKIKQQDVEKLTDKINTCAKNSYFGGTCIATGLTNCYDSLIKAGYDTTSPSPDIKKPIVFTITDGGTDHITDAKDTYQKVNKLVEHFEGASYLCSFGEYTSLDQIKNIMGERYETHFCHCTDVETLESFLTTKCCSPCIGTDFKIKVNGGKAKIINSVVTGDKTEYTIPKIFAGTTIQFIIENVPENVSIEFADINGEKQIFTCTAVPDDKGEVDKAIKIRTIRSQLDDYIENFDSKNKKIYKTFLEEIKPSINIEFLEENYMELKYTTETLSDMITSQDLPVEGGLQYNNAVRRLSSYQASTQSVRAAGGGDGIMRSMSTPHKSFSTSNTC